MFIVSYFSATNEIVLWRDDSLFSDCINISALWRRYVRRCTTMTQRCVFGDYAFRVRSAGAPSVRNVLSLGGENHPSWCYTSGLPKIGHVFSAVSRLYQLQGRGIEMRCSEAAASSASGSFPGTRALTQIADVFHVVVSQENRATLILASYSSDSSKIIKIHLRKNIVWTVWNLGLQCKSTSNFPNFAGNFFRGIFQSALINSSELWHMPGKTFQLKLAQFEVILHCKLQ